MIPHIYAVRNSSNFFVVECAMSGVIEDKHSSCSISIQPNIPAIYESLNTLLKERYPFSLFSFFLFFSPFFFFLFCFLWYWVNMRNNISQYTTRIDWQKNMLFLFVLLLAIVLISLACLEWEVLIRIFI